MVKAQPRHRENMTRCTPRRPLSTRGLRLAYETLPRWSRPPLAAVATVLAVITFEALVRLVLARLDGSQHTGVATRHIGFAAFWLACIVLCVIAVRLLLVAVRVSRGKGPRRTRRGP